MENTVMQEEYAGLARSVNGKIDNCVNQGKVESNNNIAGGIVGQVGWYNTSDKIYRKENVTNCTNKGEISSTGCITGGIVGLGSNGNSIINCINHGSVNNTGKNSSNQASCGGIVGHINNVGNNVIQDCKNYGTVSSKYNICGGIAGFIQKGTISNCENQGSVINERSNTGGIAGYVGRSDDTAKTKGTVEKCINRGNVEQTLNGANCHNTGGIVGTLQNGSTIEQSANIGNVTSHGYYATDTAVNKRSNTGGICGNVGTAGASSISYCYNIGTVKGDYRSIGGIVGDTQVSTQKIEYCYSIGDIKGPKGVLNIGGIIGYKKAGTVSNSYYLENKIIDNDGNTQTNITAQGEEKNETEIKGIISLDIWKDYYKADKTPNINKGFPILQWQ